MPNTKDQNRETLEKKKEAFLEGFLSSLDFVVGNKDLNKLIGDDKKTPLIIAIEDGNTEVVQILINKNAEVDLADKKGKTPLMYAGELGKHEIIDILLKANAKPNKQDRFGLTAVMWATLNPKQNFRAITKLIESGGGFNIAFKSTLVGIGIIVAIGGIPATMFFPPLGILVFTLGTASTLFTAGALIYSLIKKAKLYYQLLKAEHRIGQINKDVKDANKKKNDKTEEKITIKSSSMTLDFIKAITMWSSIKSFGGSLKSRFNWLFGIKPEKPVRDNSNISEEELFLVGFKASLNKDLAQHSIDLLKTAENIKLDDIKCEDGRTLLALAAQSGKPGLVKAILQKAVDDYKTEANKLIDEHNKHEKPTPKRINPKKFIKDSIKEFVNKPDKNGKTPLMYAAETGDLETIEILLKYNAKINDEDKLGWTAVMWSAATSPAKNYRTIKKLIKSGGGYNIASKSTSFTAGVVAIIAGPTVSILLPIVGIPLGAVIWAFGIAVTIIKGGSLASSLLGKAKLYFRLLRAERVMAKAKKKAESLKNVDEKQSKKMESEQYTVITNLGPSDKLLVSQSHKKIKEVLWKEPEAELQKEPEAEKPAQVETIIKEETPRKQEKIAPEPSQKNVTPRDQKTIESTLDTAGGRPVEPKVEDIMLEKKVEEDELAVEKKPVTTPISEEARTVEKPESTSN